MEEFYLKVYLFKSNRVPPIKIARNSKLKITIETMDYTIPSGATACAFAKGAFSVKIYTQKCTVDGNRVSFTPEPGFFVKGRNILQYEIGDSVIPLAIDVNCEVSLPDGGEAVEPDTVKPYVLRAEEAAEKSEAAASRAQEVKNSIPEDYTVLSDGVNQLKSDLAELENAVSVTKYIEEKLNITNGYIRIDNVVADSNYKASLEVEAGDEYLIKAKTGSELRAYVLVSNNTVIDYYNTKDSWNTLHDYDISVKIEQNGTLYVNTIDDSYIGVKKKIVEVANQNDVDELKKSDVALKSITQFNETVNLFDGTSFDGYIKYDCTIIPSDDLVYSGAIYLKAGTYMYTSAKEMVGTNAGNRIFFSNENNETIGTYIDGTELGTISEGQIYYNRTIVKFTLTSDKFVCFNLGKKSPAGNTGTVQENNFMLVNGDNIGDFPRFIKYKPSYYSVKFGELNGLSGLFGKTAIFDGDSICHGVSVGATEPTYGYGWAGRIGEANKMIWKNYGISGGVITSASSSKIPSDKHSVVDTIDTIYSDYPNADYIIIEGGTNDADHIGNAINDESVMGSFDVTDFSGNYDVTTFTGALETIFYKATNYWCGKHIGYIIAHKMAYSTVDGVQYDSAHSNRRKFFERAISVCDKWGIPYLDLWNDCYLNPSNPNMYDSTKTSTDNINNGKIYVDGQHLTAKGYDYISPIIESWMKTI